MLPRYLVHRRFPRSNDWNVHRVDDLWDEKADLTGPKSDFRFTRETGLKSDIAPRLLCAIK
jgi:hypothetical protein